MSLTPEETGAAREAISRVVDMLDDGNYAGARRYALVATVLLDDEEEEDALA